MALDFLVENGVLVIPKIGTTPGCIGVKDGKIAGIYSSATGLSAREKIDAGGRYVFPGVVEPHVHYGYRGNLKGHFQTETASAALGGVTTVIPFYRDIENPTGLYENLPDLLAMAESGWGIPSSRIIPRKRSRSSARSMASGEVPMILTPASASSAAMLRGV